MMGEYRRARRHCANRTDDQRLALAAMPPAETQLARGNQGIAVTRRQANRQHQSAARACHYQRLAAKDRPKVTIYGHTAGVLGFSDEFKAQDTREARARLLYARGWAARRK